MQLTEKRLEMDYKMAEMVELRMESGVPVPTVMMRAIRHMSMIRKKQNRFWMMQESLTQMEMESVNWMARISTLDIFLMKTVF